MLQALRRRLERDEEGFTLIELMVVVLIIAILLAIAIPTFLGARTKAQDRSAQSNLRNGLTAEKTYFVDTQAYLDTSVAGQITTLKGIESNINWAAAAAAGAVAVTTGTAATTVLVTLSQSGSCWYIEDTATGPTAGTAYAKNAPAGVVCPAAGAIVVPGAGTTTSSVAAGTWAASF